MSGSRAGWLQTGSGGHPDRHAGAIRLCQHHRSLAGSSGGQRVVGLSNATLWAVPHLGSLIVRDHEPSGLRAVRWRMGCTESASLETSRCSCPETQLALRTSSLTILPAKRQDGSLSWQHWKDREPARGLPQTEPAPGFLYSGVASDWRWRLCWARRGGVRGLPAARGCGAPGQREPGAWWQRPETGQGQGSLSLAGQQREPTPPTGLPGSLTYWPASVRGGVPVLPGLARRLSPERDHPGPAVHPAAWRGPAIPQGAGASGDSGRPEGGEPQGSLPRLWPSHGSVPDVGVRKYRLGA